MRYRIEKQQQRSTDWVGNFKKINKIDKSLVRITKKKR